MIVKVLGGENSGGQYEWIINGINYAVEQKVDIISMSLGGPSDVPELKEAVKNAVKNGVLVVCALGMKVTATNAQKSFPTPRLIMK